MKVILGEKGLKETYQDEFPKETKCKCGGMGRIAFVCIEDKEPFVYELHYNDYVTDSNPKGEGFWLHDAGAYAVYFCRKCFAAITLWNQA